MKDIVFIAYIIVIFGCGHKFDRSIWLLNENQDSNNPRFEMAKDLKSHYLGRGMTSSQVIELLGKPASTDSLKTGFKWLYGIGSNVGMHIDPYYLQIRFDSSWHLLTADIVEH